MDGDKLTFLAVICCKASNLCNVRKTFYKEICKDAGLVLGGSAGDANCYAIGSWRMIVCIVLAH
eukprot:4923018-Ditylum_brightwellii.AAC.1